MQFNHVGVSVSDIEQSIEFYCGHFGMEKLCPVIPFEGRQIDEIMDLPQARGKMIMIGRDGLQLELFEFANPVPKAKDAEYPVSDRGYSHFGFTVDDIDDTYRRLSEAGVRIHCPVTKFSGGMRATYCRDPDGNVFEIMQQT